MVCNCYDSDIGFGNGTVVMKYLSLLIATVTPTFAHAFYHEEKPDIKWPKTNYESGICITPLNTSWSWYGKTANVEDIVFSKYLNGFAYKLHIYGMNRQQYSDLFSISQIDANTAEVKPCPN